jgi:hypothetical protein
MSQLKIPAKFGREPFSSFNAVKNWLRRFLADFSSKLLVPRIIFVMPSPRGRKIVING